MSDEDNFIARWSRLKQRAAEEKKEPRPPTETEDRRPLHADAEQTAPGKGRAGPGAAAVPVGAEPPFDPATLPPIESIIAGTDIRAFLQKGVPAALTRAALRRAWTTDPAIRDFIEVAENQWDFTDPTAIPGFGPLQATDSLRQLVGQALGNLPEAPAAPGAPTASISRESRDVVASANAAAPGAPPGGPQTQRSEPPTEVQAMPTQVASLQEAPDRPGTAGDAASQHATPAQQVGNAPRRKGHGRAMPR